MKKLIYLKQEWLETKGLKKIDIANAKENIFKKSVELFRQQMKGLKIFKILQEIPPDAILIEYAEIVEDQMMAALRATEVVDIIDSMI
jgi:hypothetical protein